VRVGRHGRGSAEGSCFKGEPDAADKLAVRQVGLLGILLLSIRAPRERAMVDDHHGFPPRPSAPKDRHLCSTYDRRADQQATSFFWSWHAGLACSFLGPPRPGSLFTH